VTAPYLRGEVLSAPVGKPRPVVVLRANVFRDRDLVVVAGLTSEDIGSEVFRVPIEPTESNGLERRSFVMADFLATVQGSKFGGRIGRLSDADMLRVNAALVVFLGIEGASTR
jgi:mRNA interferase MazF